MAKSYITKFVEYVKDCKNQLKNNLIAKGQEASDTETLDSLIGKVTNINLDTSIPDSSLDYVRDPNLPDIDAMFDADPLRAVNGGEYAYCQYLVCLFPTRGSHDIKFATYWTTSYCNRIDFSDGTFYDSSNTTSNSSTKTVTIGDSGIYTLENGYEVFIVKIYADTSHSLNVYQQNFLNYSYEAITDYKSATSPSNFSSYKYLKYLRLMNTNGVYVDISNTTIGCYRSDCYLIIDGDCPPFFSFTSNYDYIWPNIKINGNLSTTSTSMVIGYTIGQYSRGSCDMVCKYLKIPDKTVDSLLDTVKIGIIFLEGLYIPDWVKTIRHDALNNSSSYQVQYTKFKKLHIGNGLISPSYFNNSTYFYNLTDLTLSPNAFSQNTSAVTLYFDSMVNLTNESIANLVTNLADRTGVATNTIRLPIVIGNRMSEEQITTLQNKNWTVTFV